jgi:hypothetical protein
MGYPESVVALLRCFAKSCVYFRSIAILEPRCASRDYVELF